jgi:hypothetical protein
MTPNADLRSHICEACGHLLDDHEPSPAFPDNAICVECFADSTVCLLPLGEVNMGTYQPSPNDSLETRP